MTIQKADSKLILAKKEVTYGVDPVPTGAANAILTRDFSMRPLEGQRRDRKYDRPGKGASSQSVSQLRRAFDFKVDLAHSSAAGVAAPWGPLVEACGYDETIVAITSVAYDPNSADGNSMAFYYNQDGVLMKALGCRGAMGLGFVAGDDPYLEFSFMGISSPATDTAAATPDYTAFQTPIEVNYANTPTCTIHGYASVLQSLTVERAPVVNYRNWVNQEAVRLGDRQYKAKASIPMVLIADWDYEAAVRNETLAALQVVHGTVAGDKVQLDAPLVQVLDYTLGEDQGDAMLNLDLLFTASDAGDDDMVLTIL